MAPLPDARLGDKIRRSGQDGAGDAAQDLVKGDIHGVEGGGDLGAGAPVERLALPQPGAVHVDRDAAQPGPGDLRRQVFPGGQPPADLALRQLQQQRRQRLVHLLQVFQGDQAFRRPDQHAVQPVQHLVALLLVDLQVAAGVEGDVRGVAALGVDAQGDLLAHGAAGHKHRLLLAQQPGDLLFELVDHLALAVAVGGQVRAGVVCQLLQLLLRRPPVVIGQEAGALVDNLVDLFLFHGVCPQEGIIPCFQWRRLFRFARNDRPNVTASLRSSPPFAAVFNYNGGGGTNESPNFCYAF